jgi:uncharacterized membrane protein YqaE (UPF0057 family)
LGKRGSASGTLLLATGRVGQRSRNKGQTETRKVSMDVLRIIIAILLPPLGVFLQVGIGKHFWINILLTILGYIPGIIHAVWVIVKY